jgi:Zn-dependent metalloprotease
MRRPVIVGFMYSAIRIMTAALLLVCSSVGAFQGALLAQVRTESKQTVETLDRLRAIYPDIRIAIDEKSGLPSSITHLRRRQDAGLLSQNLGPKKSPEQVVMEFFEGWGPGLLQMKQPNAEVRIIGSKPDRSSPGRVLVRAQQISGAVDIVGAEAVAAVNVESSSLDSINLDFVAPPTGSSVPKVDPTSAQETAANKYKAALSLSAQNRKLETAIAGSETHASTPKLVFIKTPDGANANVGTRLAYMVQVGTYVFFVDALESGKIIDSHRDLLELQQRNTYDSSLTSNLPGVLVLTQDTEAVDTSQIPPDARNVHAFASDVYGYYLAKFGRDGYDVESPHAFNSCVRFSAMDNALWIPLVQKTVYAPGFADAIEIAGHEWTHAVIEHEVGLGLKDESGALNEALADFFGVMVRSHKTGILAWRIGDTLKGHIPPNPPLRDLRNPHGTGFDRGQPSGPTNSGGAGHYNELAKNADPICQTPDGYSDNGCVHINSTVFSKALQLTVEGGTYLGLQVSAGESFKVEEITYTAMTRMTSGTSLLGGARLMIQVCQELQGSATVAITSADCQNLAKAFKAVGLNGN